MTDQVRKEQQPYGDPTTYEFWDAAQEGRFLIQRCTTCGAHQFYPRPFCLTCGRQDVTWVEAAGTGVVYAMTTVRIPVSKHFDPPYVVAVVELDEGPRVLTNIVGHECAIGDRVQLDWLDRAEEPPLPVFRPSEE